MRKKKLRMKKKMKMRLKMKKKMKVLRKNLTVSPKMKICLTDSDSNGSLKQSKLISNTKHLWLSLSQKSRKIRQKIS
jgi:hypothetical protein